MKGWGESGRPWREKEGGGKEKERKRASYIYTQAGESENERLTKPSGDEVVWAPAFWCLRHKKFIVTWA